MNTLFNRIILSLFFAFLFLFSNRLTAQNSEEKDSIAPKQEFKLDIFQLIILPSIEISYERFIDNYSSWGVTGFFNFDFDSSQYYRYENFELSPFYRFYFSKNNKRNAGFFVQPFLSLTQGEYDTDDAYYNCHNCDSISKQKDFFGLAAGAVIGKKWVNQKYYTFEITAGVGRLLTKDNSLGSTAYPRINFAIGKRF